MEATKKTKKSKGQGPAAAAAAAAQRVPKRHQAAAAAAERPKDVLRLPVARRLHLRSGIRRSGPTALRTTVELTHAEVTRLAQHMANYIRSDATGSHTGKTASMRALRHALSALGYRRALVKRRGGIVGRKRLVAKKAGGGAKGKKSKKVTPAAETAEAAAVDSGMVDE